MPEKRDTPTDFPAIRTFYPTMEQLSNFEEYWKYLESEGAHLAGMAKIHFPDEWVGRKKGYDVEGSLAADVRTLASPWKQVFRKFGGQSGAFQSRAMKQEPMSLADYKKLSDGPTHGAPANDGPEDLEKKYWRSVHHGPAAIYGADNAAMSLTDEDQRVWNVAKLAHTNVMRVLKDAFDLEIAGMNTACVDFGMWKSTFVWHVEDMDFGSMNYIHFGAAKQWYCVPPKYGYAFERCALKVFPNIAKLCKNFLRHKNTLISPKLLEDHGVPYQKMVCEERECMVIFPYAYHSGFNHGFNCAESANWANERWIEYGKRAKQCDCGTSNRVKFSLDPWVKKFQPDLLDDWLSGRDIQPHPEDPADVREDVLLRAREPEEWRRRQVARALEETGTKRPYGCFKSPSSAKLFHVNLDRMKVRSSERSEMSKTEKRELTQWKKRHTTIEMNVYQYTEKPEIEIRLAPVDMNYDPKELKKLQHATKDHDDIGTMIEKNTLIRVGTKVVHILSASELSDGARAAAAAAKPQPTERIVHVYKHIDSDLELALDSQRLTIRGKRSKKFFGIFGDRKVPELIKEGELVFSREEKKKIKKEKDDEDEEDNDENCRFDTYRLAKERSATCRINPYTLATRDVEENLEPHLENKSVYDLIHEGTLVKANKFISISYDIVRERVPSVEVALLKDRTIYKIAIGSDATATMLKDNNLEDLEEIEKVVASRRKVKAGTEHVLRDLLTTKFEIQRFEEYVYKGNCVTIDPTTYKITKGDKKDKDRIEEKGGAKKLIESGKLKDMKERYKIAGKIGVMKNLYGDNFGDITEKELKIDADMTFEMTTITDYKSKSIYIIKKEKPFPERRNADASSKLENAVMNGQEPPEKKIKLENSVFGPNQPNLVLTTGVTGGVIEAKVDPDKFMVKGTYEFIDIEDLDQNFSDEEDEEAKRNEEYYGHSDDSDDEYGLAQLKKKRSYGWLGVDAHRQYPAFKLNMRKNKPNIDEDLDEYVEDFPRDDIRNISVPLDLVKIKFNDPLSDYGEVKCLDLRTGKMARHKVYEPRPQHWSESMAAVGKVCKCDEKLGLAKGVGGAWKGKQRRFPCRKCANCVRPKCGKCSNCLKPSNKQACIERKCLFPKIPNCPCFK